MTYTPANAIFTAASSTNNYNQIIIQNSLQGTNASADVIVNNNLSTDSTYYGDFGINSSVFSGTGSLSLPNATYLYSANGDLAIGTSTSNAIHFVVNNGSTDAITISTSGSVSIPGLTGYSPTSDFTAAGQIRVGTGSGTYAVLSAGTNGWTLVSDSTQTNGVRWSNDTQIMNIMGAY